MFYKTPLVWFPNEMPLEGSVGSFLSVTDRTVCTFTHLNGKWRSKAPIVKDLLLQCEKMAESLC